MNKAPDPDQPEPDLPQRHKGTKNSKSINHKEAQKTQRIQFFPASLALFCGKYAFFEKN